MSNVVQFLDATKLSDLKKRKWNKAYISLDTGVAEFLDGNTRLRWTFPQFLTNERNAIIHRNSINWIKSIRMQSFVVNRFPHNGRVTILLEEFSTQSFCTPDKFHFVTLVNELANAIPIDTRAQSYVPAITINDFTLDKFELLSGYKFSEGKYSFNDLFIPPDTITIALRDPYLPVKINRNIYQNVIYSQTYPAYSTLTFRTPHLLDEKLAYNVSTIPSIGYGKIETFNLSEYTTSSGSDVAITSVINSTTYDTSMILTNNISSYAVLQYNSSSIQYKYVLKDSSDKLVNVLIGTKWYPNVIISFGITYYQLKFVDVTKAQILSNNSNAEYTVIGYTTEYPSDDAYIINNVNSGPNLPDLIFENSNMITNRIVIPTTCNFANMKNNINQKATITFSSPSTGGTVYNVIVKPYYNSLICVFPSNIPIAQELFSCDVQITNWTFLHPADIVENNYIVNTLFTPTLPPYYSTYNVLISGPSLPSNSMYNVTNGILTQSINADLTFTTTDLTSSMIGLNSGNNLLDTYYRYNKLLDGTPISTHTIYGYSFYNISPNPFSQIIAWNDIQAVVSIITSQSTNSYPCTMTFNYFTRIVSFIFESNINIPISSNIQIISMDYSPGSVMGQLAKTVLMSKYYPVTSNRLYLGKKYNLLPSNELYYSQTIPQSIFCYMRYKVNPSNTLYTGWIKFGSSIECILTDTTNITDVTSMSIVSYNPNKTEDIKPYLISSSNPFYIRNYSTMTSNTTIKGYDLEGHISGLIDKSSKNIVIDDYNGNTYNVLATPDGNSLSCIITIPLVTPITKFRIANSSYTSIYGNGNDLIALTLINGYSTFTGNFNKTTVLCEPALITIPASTNSFKTPFRATASFLNDKYESIILPGNMQTSIYLPIGLEPPSNTVAVDANTSDLQYNENLSLMTQYSKPTPNKLIYPQTTNLASNLVDAYPSYALLSFGSNARQYVIFIPGYSIFTLLSADPLIPNDLDAFMPRASSYSLFIDGLTSNLESDNTAVARINSREYTFVQILNEYQLLIGEAVETPIGVTEPINIANPIIDINNLLSGVPSDVTVTLITERYTLNLEIEYC